MRSFLLLVVALFVVHAGLRRRWGKGLGDFSVFKLLLLEGQIADFEIAQWVKPAEGVEQVDADYFKPKPKPKV